MIGTRLGSYEITAKLGEGGMGEVFRARDSRLKREVAIKVLPAAFTADPERLARFEREAQLLAQLHHPNIASIFGLEEADGVRALVMELVEGPTLAARLETAALPVEECLAIACQIAEALEEAHEKGIVHRDLKPQNVKVTSDGRVKVLDFGLAKAMEPASGVPAGIVPATSPTLVNSPTLTAAHGTQLGMILGTAAYMAPEQARGGTVDRRADIWAFGVVVYEMLTGEHLFAGESVVDTLSAVMRQEIDLRRLPPATPRRLRELLRRCLERQVKNRLHDIADARLVLDELQRGVPDELESNAPTGVTAIATSRQRRRERLAWGLAALAGLVAAALGARACVRPAPTAALARLAVTNPPAAPFAFWGMAAVSPDGGRIAFVGVLPDGKPQIWLRDLADETPHPLAGTEGAEQPFWSPDGRHLGFFAHDQLLRIDADGGPPRELCAAPNPRGGSWGSDATILFSSDTAPSLVRVSAEGGTPAPATRLGPREEAHRWPSFLADGRHFVFLGDAVHTEDHHLKLGALGSLESSDLVQAVSNPVYAGPGYLLYVRGGVLLAQRLDERAGRLAGDPVQVAARIAPAGENHRFEFSASPAGLVTYRSASPLARLEWLDRAGRRLAVVGEPQAMGGRIALSPDARGVAWEQLDNDGRHADIWLLDLERGSSSRVTLDPTSDFAPVWSPGGDRLAWSSYRSGGGDLYTGSPFDPGSARLLLGSPAEKTLDSWTERFLLFEVGRGGPTASDVWLLPLSPPGEPRPLVATPASEGNSTATRDGRRIAYVSNESGRPEVYVQSYPPSGRRWQMSTGGALRPRWRADGQELFFFDLQNNLMSVAIDDRAELAAGAPQKLFQIDIWSDYDVAPDGQRILLERPLEDRGTAPLTVVVNWRQGLKKQSSE